MRHNKTSTSHSNIPRSAPPHLSLLLPRPNSPLVLPPQAYLGAQIPNVAGVVLHSPLLSGIRVLSPGLRWWPSFADVYPNHLMAPKIQAPTLVMHVRLGEWYGRPCTTEPATRKGMFPSLILLVFLQGTEDEVIHISCGQRLHELCKNPVEPLWAEGFNHQVWGLRTRT